MKTRLLIILSLLLLFCKPGYSQENVSLQKADSAVAVVEPVDSTVAAVLRSADSVSVPNVKLAPAFKPDPKKAVLLALVPGLGQIYNQKYWKLPIVYGGLMGCMYAVTWNNRNYKDYSTAYKDIMSDYYMIQENSKKDPDEQIVITKDHLSKSWQELLSPGADPLEYVDNTQFQNALKNQKDYYRRYRDLSIIITVGVYALSIIDAYVDAQLFDLDISPDLSMRVEPVVSPRTSRPSELYGLNCSLKF